MSNSQERVGGIENQCPETSRGGDSGFPPAKTCCGPEISDCGHATDSRGGEGGNRSKSREAEKKARCSNCSMRARYDRNPKSLIGRVWRWHTGFCPGWKSYMKGLADEERAEVVEKYNLK